MIYIVLPSIQYYGDVDMLVYCHMHDLLTNMTEKQWDGLGTEIECLCCHRYRDGDKHGMELTVDSLGNIDQRECNCFFNVEHHGFMSKEKLKEHNTHTFEDSEQLEAESIMWDREHHPVRVSRSKEKMFCM